MHLSLERPDKKDVQDGLYQGEVFKLIRNKNGIIEARNKEHGRRIFKAEQLEARKEW